MRRWVSFHGLLRSETEFRHHLPVVLRIHTLLRQDVYLENSGEVLPKFLTKNNLLSFYAGEEYVGGDPEDPDRLRRRHGSACTASPRHCVDSPLPR